MKWSGRSAIAIAGVCAAATLFSGTAQASPLWEPLQPVANLDAARYVGDWNQVAAIPQPSTSRARRTPGRVTGSSIRRT